MENLKIDGQSITLVDQVEDKLLNYFRSQDLKVGDSIPNEIELSSALGVARSVLREALSRLKMMGMIESRTRRGMILTEPFILGGMKRVVDPRIMSQESLLDLLGFRVALEIGISSDIFHNIKEQDIMELEEIVNAGVALGNNEYANLSEYTFHSKLYEITGNKTIVQFQSIIHPVMNFVKTNSKLRFSRATSSSSTIATLYLSMFLLCFSSREYIHNPTPIQSNRRSFTDYLSVNMPILAKNKIKRFF